MAVSVVSKVEVPELVAKRHGQLLRAAIDLYGKQGYHVTTIREVAQQAGISVGLVYQYVTDKEDILFLALVEVLDSYLSEVPKALEGLADPMERFCAAVRAYGYVIDERTEATVLVYRETKWLSRERRNLIKQKESESNQLISACIERCVRDGLFGEDTDLDLFTYQIVMFCHAWALKAWHFRRQMEIDEYLDRGLKQMLNGVVTTRGKRSYARWVEAQAVLGKSPASRATRAQVRRKRATAAK